MPPQRHAYSFILRSLHRSPSPVYHFSTVTKASTCALFLDYLLNTIGITPSKLLHQQQLVNKKAYHIIKELLLTTIIQILFQLLRDNINAINFLVLFFSVGWETKPRHSRGVLWLTNGCKRSNSIPTCINFTYAFPSIRRRKFRRYASFDCSI